MAKNNWSNFSSKALLEEQLKDLEEASERNPSLSSAIARTKETIENKLDPSYVRVTSREMYDVSLEVNLLMQADKDLDTFKGNENVKQHIVNKVNSIHPTFD